MSPTHARARGKRFHYYVSNRIKGARRTDSTAWRIPAPAMDAAVMQFAIGVLNDHVRLSEWIAAYAPSSSAQASLGKAGSIARLLTEATRSERRQFLETILSRITLDAELITVKVDAAAIVRLLTHPSMILGESDPQGVSGFPCVVGHNG